MALASPCWPALSFACFSRSSTTSFFIGAVGEAKRGTIDHRVFPGRRLRRRDRRSSARFPAAICNLFGNHFRLERASWAMPAHSTWKTAAPIERSNRRATAAGQAARAGAAALRVGAGGPVLPLPPFRADAPACRRSRELTMPVLWPALAALRLWPISACSSSGASAAISSSGNMARRSTPGRLARATSSGCASRGSIRCTSRPWLRWSALQAVHRQLTGIGLRLSGQ